MILQHYIKVALRNLTKYKVQSTISIVGLAIGLIVARSVFQILNLFPILRTTTGSIHNPSKFTGYTESINKRERNRRNYHLFWHAN